MNGQVDAPHTDNHWSSDEDESDHAKSSDGSGRNGNLTKSHKAKQLLKKMAPKIKAPEKHKNSGDGGNADGDKGQNKPAKGTSSGDRASMLVQEAREICPQGSECDSVDPRHFVDFEHTERQKKDEYLTSTYAYFPSPPSSPNTSTITTSPNTSTITLSPNTSAITISPNTSTISDGARNHYLSPNQNGGNGARGQSNGTAQWDSALGNTSAASGDTTQGQRPRSAQKLLIISQYTLDEIKGEDPASSGNQHSSAGNGSNINKQGSGIFPRQGMLVGYVPTEQVDSYEDLLTVSSDTGSTVYRYEANTVEGFLERLDLTIYLLEFHKRQINEFSALLALPEEDFYKMDIPTTDLKRIIKKIDKIKKSPDDYINEKNNTTDNNNNKNNNSRSNNNTNTNATTTTTTINNNNNNNSKVASLYFKPGVINNNNKNNNNNNNNNNNISVHITSPSSTTTSTTSVLDHGNKATTTPPPQQQQRPMIKTPSQLSLAYQDLLLSSPPSISSGNNSPNSNNNNNNNDIDSESEGWSESSFTETFSDIDVLAQWERMQAALKDALNLAVEQKERVTSLENQLEDEKRRNDEMQKLLAELQKSKENRRHKRRQRAKEAKLNRDTGSPQVDQANESSRHHRHHHHRRRHRNRNNNDDDDDNNDDNNKQAGSKKKKMKKVTSDRSPSSPEKLTGVPVKRRNSADGISEIIPNSEKSKQQQTQSPSLQQQSSSSSSPSTTTTTKDVASNSTGVTFTHDRNNQASSSASASLPSSPAGSPSIPSSSESAGVTTSKSAPTSPVISSSSSGSNNNNASNNNKKMNLDDDSGSEVFTRGASMISTKQRQADLRVWIEEVTKEPLESEDFITALKSGVMLCKLIQGIRPDLIKPNTALHSHRRPTLFRQIENITQFIRACIALGVRNSDLFEPSDLYEEKNSLRVISCLEALAREVAKLNDYHGPLLKHVRVSRDQISEELSKQGVLLYSYPIKINIALPPPATNDTGSSSSKPTSTSNSSTENSPVIHAVNNNNNNNNSSNKSTSASGKVAGGGSGSATSSDPATPVSTSPLTSPTAVSRQQHHLAPINMGGVNNNNNNNNTAEFISPKSPKETEKERRERKKREEEQAKKERERLKREKQEEKERLKRLNKEGGGGGGGGGAGRARFTDIMSSMRLTMEGKVNKKGGRRRVVRSDEVEDAYYNNARMPENDGWVFSDSYPETVDGQTQIYRDRPIVRPPPRKKITYS